MKTTLLLIFVLAAWSPFGSMLLPDFEPCQQAELSSVLGAVMAIDKSSKIVTLKSDQGATVNVITAETTVFLRVSVEAKSLDEASSIRFDTVSVGDRVLARGSRSQNDFNALRVVVLTKADISKRREHDLDEWRKRGIAGIV